MQQKNGASVCVLGGTMHQLPLCCKTTKDKQKQHITSSKTYVMQGHDSCVDILLVPNFHDNFL